MKIKATYMKSIELEIDDKFRAIDGESPTDVYDLLDELGNIVNKTILAADPAAENVYSEEDEPSYFMWVDSLDTGNTILAN